jgi:diguanylate cyclase (GGDEF)-like protein
MTVETKHASTRLALYVVVLLTAGVLAWLAVYLHGPRGPQPQVLARLPGTLALALAAGSLRRVAVTPGLPTAVRRFWNQIALASALCAVASVICRYVALRASGEETSLNPVSAVIYLVAMLGAVWALLRVPIGHRTASDWIRLSLDGVTIILGAVLFVWYLAFAPVLAGDRSFGAIWAPLAIGVLCLIGLAAIIKIVLAGSGPIDPGALRLIGGGLLLGGISAGFTTLIGRDVDAMVPGHLLVPVICWLTILAGKRQRRAARQPSPQHRRRRRPYSLLPYAAVAATDALLVLTTFRPGDERRHVVVVGAITITALVVVRQLVAFVDNARLVDKLREREDQLRHQASHDALTQLANRTLFGERVDAALDAGCHGVLAVLLVDLDDFKTVNDTLGHHVGDALLAAAARRIQSCVHPEDMVSRLGGDEFALLLQKASAGEVDAIAEQVLGSLTRPLVVDGCQLLMQASIGVAIARPGDDSGTLLRNADIAMYAGKERGKGRFVRYAPGMGAQVPEHAQLGAQLRQALDDGQLHLLYQPVVRFADRRIIGVEALVRWRHPVRGLVSPGAFIPAAERTGLIVPLGRWALHEACRQRAVWSKAHGDASPETVGVNVSGRQLQEPGFAEEVLDAVHEAGLQPHDLVLEVTETAVLTGGQVHQTLAALHDCGVGLALDDFGTGQSSLGLVRTCPVHILKLDKSFVDGITDGGQHAAVAMAVVQMAQALGLNAIAEGIESGEQADFLVELGYFLGQGFHFAPPLLAEQLDAILSLEAYTGRCDTTTAVSRTLPSPPMARAVGHHDGADPRVCAPQADGPSAWVGCGMGHLLR